MATTPFVIRVSGDWVHTLYKKPKWHEIIQVQWDFARVDYLVQESPYWIAKQPREHPKQKKIVIHTSGPYLQGRSLRGVHPLKFVKKQEIREKNR